jgi:ribokinase
VTEASKPKLCVIGSINVDTTYRVQQIPVLGETILASHKSVAPGGKGANQAVAAASMGSRVSMVGCIGSDPDGEYALHSLVARDVDVSQVRALGKAPTGTAVLIVDEHGENVIVVDPGANQCLDPHQVAAHLSLVQYDVVLAQLEVNLDAVVAAASSCGAATFVLNPAPMKASHAALNELLKHTDVLVPNRLELARLAGREPPTDQAALDRCVAELGFGGVMSVTLGSAGVAVYERGPGRRPTLIEAVPVPTVDTSGAGDVFCGVFCHWMAKDGNVVGAARRANEMAALSTTFRGAQLPPSLATSPGRRPSSAAPPSRT